MHIYFLLIHIAALFGHKKARLLVRGQQELKTNSQKLTAHKGAIWFHAASVGEFEQARPLIERLRREHPQRKIVVTFFSPSGYEMRKDYPQADGIYYLPFATRRNARRFLDALQPSMAVFVKYEFWPAYLRELKKRTIPTYSICAIFRPKQRFFRWWGKGSLSLLKCFTHIYVQDEASRTLLTSHGISACSVAGDTRFDRMAEVCRQQSAISTQMAERMAPVMQFVQGAGQVIIAGSTWPEDEVLLAQYISRQPADMSCQTKLILVPHEIDANHMHFIFNLFKGRLIRYSQHLAVPAGYIGADVMVVDTMGLLSSLYTLGHAAYIGGGFGAGIHNTIEAAAYGMPVIFGPKYHHFREAEGLIQAGAARSIRNYKELEDALDTALAQHQTIGAKAAAYVQSELGTTNRIYHAIFEI